MPYSSRLSPWSWEAYSKKQNAEKPDELKTEKCKWDSDKMNDHLSKTKKRLCHSPQTNDFFLSNVTLSVPKATVMYVCPVSVGLSFVAGFGQFVNTRFFSAEPSKLVYLSAPPSKRRRVLEDRRYKEIGGNMAMIDLTSVRRSGFFSLIFSGLLPQVNPLESIWNLLIHDAKKTDVGYELQVRVPGDFTETLVLKHHQRFHDQTRRWTILEMLAISLFAGNCAMCRIRLLYCPMSGEQVFNAQNLMQIEHNFYCVGKRLKALLSQKNEGSEVTPMVTEIV